LALARAAAVAGGTVPRAEATFAKGGIHAIRTTVPDASLPFGASKKTLDMKSPAMIGLLMFRKALSARGAIPVIMCFQVVPLLVFPASSYTLKSQEWWLPALLTFLVVIALVQILIRKSQAAWPWYLVSFAQGVNIISRLMMLLPHATTIIAARPHFNAGYFVIAAAAMIVSALEIWYNELPEVRRKLFST
jgi:hypothetical protein